MSSERTTQQKRGYTKMTTEFSLQRKIDYRSEYPDTNNLRSKGITAADSKRAIQIANYQYFMRNIKK